MENKKRKRRVVYNKQKKRKMSFWETESSIYSGNDEVKKKENTIIIKEAIGEGGFGCVIKANIRYSNITPVNSETVFPDRLLDTSILSTQEINEDTVILKIQSAHENMREINRFKKESNILEYITSLEKMKYMPNILKFYDSFYVADIPKALSNRMIQEGGLCSEFADIEIDCKDNANKLMKFADKSCKNVLFPILIQEYADMDTLDNYVDNIDIINPISGEFSRTQLRNIFFQLLWQKMVLNKTLNLKHFDIKPDNIALRKVREKTIYEYVLSFESPVDEDNSISIAKEVEKKWYFEVGYSEDDKKSNAINPYVFIDFELIFIDFGLADISTDSYFIPKGTIEYVDPETLFFFNRKTEFGEFRSMGSDIYSIAMIMAEISINSWNDFEGCVGYKYEDEMCDIVTSQRICELYSEIRGSEESINFIMRTLITRIKNTTYSPENALLKMGGNNFVDNLRIQIECLIGTCLFQEALGNNFLPTNDDIAGIENLIIYQVLKELKDYILDMALIFGDDDAFDLNLLHSNSKIDGLNVYYSCVDRLKKQFGDSGFNLLREMLSWSDANRLRPNDKYKSIDTAFDILCHDFFNEDTFSNSDEYIRYINREFKGNFAKEQFKWNVWRFSEKDHIKISKDSESQFERPYTTIDYNEWKFVDGML